MRPPISTRPLPLIATKSATAFLLAALLSLALGLSGCASPAPATSPAGPDAAVTQTEQGGAASHLTFRTEEKLQQHFDKHGWETGTANPDEYLAAANAVIANPAAIHKLQAEDGDDLYYLDATGEFVVVSPAGYIRTYFITDRDYFDRQ